MNPQALTSMNENTLDGTRLVSLDVFRGLTICLMIIVNSPGKGAEAYSFLIHAKWFGFTLADLVFPSFLFVVGNAIGLSSRKNILTSQFFFLRRVLKRTLLIFIIGYLMYWFPFIRQQADGGLVLKPLSDTRVMGVLQRIALCYGIVTLLTNYLRARSLIVISAMLLMSYWGMLYFFGDVGQELTMNGNAIKKLDIFLLGENHIYKRDTIPFDPEGILSTLPAVVNVIAGYLVFLFVERKGKTRACIIKLIIAGLVLVVVAQGWAVVFPIAKKLWTSSFALYTIGLDMIILAVLIYVIDVRKFSKGVFFFNVFGKNPLFIYLFSEIAYTVLTTIKLSDGQSIYEWISITIFQRILPGSIGSLVTGVWFMLMCWLVGWWLDVKKKYVRI